MNAPTPAELRQAHQAIHAARQELDQLAATIHALAPHVLAYEAGLADGRAVAWRPRPGPLTVTVDDDEWAQWCDRTGTPRPGPGQRDIFGGEHW